MADRTIVAVHEAGHYVAARARGIPIRYATLDDPEAGPHVQLRLSRDEIDADPAVALAFAEFLLAGAAAVARYRPAAADRGDADDLKAARATLDRLYRDPRAARLALEGLRRRTAALLAAHWSAVIDVAGVLLAEGTLGPTRIAAPLAAEAGHCCAGWGGGAHIKLSPHGRR